MLPEIEQLAQIRLSEGLSFVQLAAEVATVCTAEGVKRPPSPRGLANIINEGVTPQDLMLHRVRVFLAARRAEVGTKRGRVKKA